MRIVSLAAFVCLCYLIIFDSFEAKRAGRLRRRVMQEEVGAIVDDANCLSRIVRGEGYSSRRG